MPDNKSRQTDFGLHADSFRGHGRVSIYDARGNGGVSSHIRLQEIIKIGLRTTRR